MRLTMEQIEKVSSLIFERLKEKDLVIFKSPEQAVLKKIHDAILADLRAEDALDREVEEILKTHTGAIDTQRLDYRKMFSMVKAKLAKEREIVI